MRVLLLRNVINHIYVYPRLNYTTGEKTDSVKYFQVSFKVPPNNHIRTAPTRNKLSVPDLYFSS